MLKQASTDNMSTSSAQEVFDFIVTHLRAQGMRAETVAIGGMSACKYRLDNLKCPAGRLIPDEEYLPSFEGKDWFWVSGKLGVDSHHYYLINSMQAIHDKREVSEWENLFESVAAQNELILAAR